jgi:hypothetical protein
MKPKHYPFVSPAIANTLKKLGFDERCYAVYEKGYLDNGKKKKAKLFSSGIQLIESKWLAEYYKRPGMFKGKSCSNSNLSPWLTAAPTYQQAMDWFREKHMIHIEVRFAYSFALTKPYYSAYINTMDLINYGISSKQGCADYFVCLKEAINDTLKLIKNGKSY